MQIFFILKLLIKFKTYRVQNRNEDIQPLSSESFKDLANKLQNAYELGKVFQNPRKCETYFSECLLKTDDIIKVLS